MPTADKEFTSIVRARLEKACREFTLPVKPLGFQRTRTMFWTRRHPLTIDFIHFHRGGSSYGASISAQVDIRVHFGIRVLNDDFVAAALNGAHSNPGILRAGRYHLRFNAETGSTYERCVDDLTRFVIEQGEPWFQRFRDVEALLQSHDSPLNSRDKESLCAACNGQSNADRIATSLKILGIREA